MEPSIINAEELKKLYDQALAGSDRAARENPERYRRLRCLLCRVLEHPVDVEDWSGLATTVADLCRDMGPGTIFSEYYHEHIHPQKKGRARFFRTECRELKRLCDDMAFRRREKSGLRLVKKQ